MEKRAVVFHFHYAAHFFLAIAAVFFAFIGQHPDQTRGVFICTVVLGAGCILLINGVRNYRRHSLVDRQAGLSFLVCGIALLLAFGTWHSTGELPGDLSLFLVPFFFFIAIPSVSLLMSTKPAGLPLFRREDLVAVLLCALFLFFFDGSIVFLVYTGNLFFYGAANALLYLLPVWYFVLGKGFRFVPVLCFAGTMAHLCTSAKMLIALVPPRPEDYMKAVFQDTLSWLVLSLIYGLLCFILLKMRNRSKNQDFINGSASK